MASPGSGGLTLDSGSAGQSWAPACHHCDLEEVTLPHLSFLELGKVSVVSEGLPHEKRPVLGGRE